MNSNLWLIYFLCLYHGVRTYALYSRYEYHWNQPKQNRRDSQCLEGWTCVAVQDCHGAIRPWYLPKSRCGKYMTLVCCGPVANTSNPTHTGARYTQRKGNLSNNKSSDNKPENLKYGVGRKTSTTNLSKSTNQETNIRKLNSTSSNPGKKLSRSEQACKNYSQVKRGRKRRFSPTLQTMTRQMVSGELIEINELPFLVAIGYNPKGNSSPSAVSWLCGGTIISENYVLTAAHCITDAESKQMVVTTVRVGQTRVSGSARPGQDYGVADIKRHPGHRANEQHHDLALLRLDKPLRFSDTVRPACLPPPTGGASALEAPGKKLVAAGWGATSPIGAGRSEQLLKAELTVMPLDECRKIYENANIRTALNVLNEKVLCASDPKKKSGTCNGDSGGPLVARLPSGTYILIGVTSFGSSPCAGKVPDVYARTAAEITWIESHVWP